MREDGQLPEALRQMLQAMCQSMGMNPEMVSEIMVDLEKQREQQMFIPLTDEQAAHYVNGLALPSCYPTPMAFWN